MAAASSAFSPVSYRETLSWAWTIRQRRPTMTGLSLVVKRSFNEKNRRFPRTEAAIVAAAEEEGGGWAAGQKPSFFAGGEELQGFLEVLDGCAHVLVLQGAASILAEPLRLGEVLRRELDATCREQRRRTSTGVEPTDEPLCKHGLMFLGFSTRQEVQ